ncbi:MAG TPA: pyruvate, phosphate dikinase, partial [Blastocatellia bacterium]|nr:pyruvate, phosphate dikinase [Blastocatellia bacterium]
GISVPDGFSIPFFWYDEFMKRNGLDKRIEAMIQEYDFVHNPRYRRQRLEGLRAAIQQGTFDPGLRGAVLRKWRNQLRQRPVFVRSSSNAEDLPNFSGAGLYSSVANVRTNAGLIEAVKKVWASLWKFEAYEARVRNYVSQTDVYMSALIQIGVDMQKGGVMITRDPYDSGRTDAVFISAVCGHNSRVVDNSGIPEQILFDFAKDSILVRTLSDQINSLRFSAAGDLKPVNDRCAD